MEQAAYRAEAAAVDQMIFVANSLPTDTGKQTDDCLAMRRRSLRGAIQMTVTVSVQFTCAQKVDVSQF